MRDDIDDLTPVMDAPDIETAQQLSCSRLRPPVVIPGFEQKDFLGRGSFGEVWKAVDSNNGRLVAIKYFRRGGGIDWSHMAREVEKLRYLFSDRHVVQLFDVGWDSEPPYFIMEYMERGSLEDRLREGPLSVSEALQIIRDVAQGLVHAHDKGVLHCDLKPANIMLDQDGQPRLADFGQARLRQDLSPSLGTLFYMAPDQADLKALPDARWDVYALGVILYRMLTGQLPYRVPEAESSKWSSGTIEERLAGYREHLLQSDKPTAHRQVAGVDKSLVDIIDRCIATNPKHRFHNVQAVLTALDQRAARLAKRSLLIVGGIGPMAVTLVLAVIAWVVFRNSIGMASVELLNRTKESNTFAAESVAARLALEVDKRWSILQREAGALELKQLLMRSQEEPSSSSADELDTSIAPTAEAPHSQESDSAARRWIDARYRTWNNQFGETGQAAYWFVLDRQGRLQMISPLEEQLIGQYFGYRDYFHGQGLELPKTENAPKPITIPYRSAVFRSQPGNVLAVAFSVPIWDDPDERNKVVGVLVMETILSHISEFRSSRKQAAVMVDLRPDQTGRAGRIVDHPRFAPLAQSSEPLGEFYISESMLKRISQIHASHLADDEPTGGSETESILTGYDDPVTDERESDYFSAVEPVFVSRGDEPRVDTGWSILIQERRADTLAPLARVWSIFVRGGIIGLVLVVALLAVLWALVVFVVNRPSDRALGKRGGASGSGLSSGSSRSA